MPVLAHPAFGGLAADLARGAPRQALPALRGRRRHLPELRRAVQLQPPTSARASPGRCARPRPPPPPAFPVPAGGMKVESMPAVLDFYGADTVLLIGGSLLDAPDEAALLSRCRQFVAAVHAFTVTADEQEEPHPPRPSPSAGRASPFSPTRRTAARISRTSPARCSSTTATTTTRSCATSRSRRGAIRPWRGTTMRTPSWSCAAGATRSWAARSTSSARTTSCASPR